MARKPSLPPDKKDKPPAKISDAKRLIERTFGEQPWDSSEQKRYFALLGIGNDLENLTADETRRVIRDLEKFKMVIF